MHELDRILPDTAHEENLLNVFRPHKYRTFVDVGAHVGTWVKALTHNCEKILAIEPVLHKELIENINKWNSNNVFVLCEAAGRENTTSTIKVFDVHSRSTMCDQHPISDPADNEFKLLEINVKTLDNILKDQNEVDLIKIDVEGYELEVIEGAQDVLKRLNPMLCIECHSPSILAELFERMEEVQVYYWNAAYVVGHMFKT